MDEANCATSTSAPPSSAAVVENQGASGDVMAGSCLGSSPSCRLYPMCVARSCPASRNIRGVGMPLDLLVSSCLLLMRTQPNG